MIRQRREGSVSASARTAVSQGPQRAGRALIAAAVLCAAAGWTSGTVHAQSDAPDVEVDLEVLEELQLRPSPAPLLQPGHNELPIFAPPLPGRRPTAPQTAGDTTRRPNTPPPAPDWTAPLPAHPPSVLAERPPQPPTSTEPPEPQRLVADDEPSVASTESPLSGETVFTLPDNQGFRLLFANGSDHLTEAGGRLLSGLAERMRNNEDLRLQIRAYADGTPDTASRARRLSLNRALIVRTFLIDRGVRGTRIDVRALGNTAPDPPQDRVDLLLSG